jgi:hypothetical protein
MTQFSYGLTLASTFIGCVGSHSTSTDVNLCTTITINEDVWPTLPT